MYRFQSICYDALKICKIANMKPKNLFSSKLLRAIKKPHNLMLIPSSLKWPQKMFWEKVLKKICELCVFWILHFFLCFFLKLNFQNIFQELISTNLESFCVFYSLLQFLPRKKFWVILALFSNFECICSKNGTFSTFC